MMYFCIFVSLVCGSRYRTMAPSFLAHYRRSQMANIE